MPFKIISQTLNSQTRNLGKDEILFNQGETVSNIYFINEGKIKLTRNTIDGFPITLHVGQSGEFIAEASLFSEHYHCTAITNSSSQIAYVKKKELLHYLEENPSAMMDLLSIFANQVRDLRSINEIKNIRSAKDRILTFIHANVNSEKVLTVDIPLKDIAHNLGLAHETFYRELRKLEDSETIKRDTHEIKLL